MLLSAVPRPPCSICHQVDSFLTKADVPVSLEVHKVSISHHNSTGSDMYIFIPICSTTLLSCLDVTKGNLALHSPNQISFPDNVLPCLHRTV